MDNTSLIFDDDVRELLAPTLWECDANDSGDKVRQDDDILVFDDDDDDDDDLKSDNLEGLKDNVWHMLVVDDEPEVHSVTRLALTGFTFAGKKLSIHSAYDAEEAKVMLSGSTQYAIALLDVVMESEHAGLDLARWIRQSLKDKHIRLVLRTGQPGQAPEREVIADYDINDYKEKTELTANKLYTLTYSCLRSYRDIVSLYQNKLGLETIIQSSNKIFAHQSLSGFTQGALQQLCALLHIDAGALYSEVDSFAASHGESGSNVLAATGRYQQFLNKPLNAVLSARRDHKLQMLLETGGQHFGDDYFIGVYESHLERKNVLFLEGIDVSTELDKQLVELFGTNIGVAFDNQSMYEEVEVTQREMVYRMSEAVESRSKETSNHVKRMAMICRYLATHIDMSSREVEILYKAAPLHDIGKIAIPDHILNKPGTFIAEEWQVMQTHAQIGADILASSELEVLRAGAIIAGEHHENWDGSGYPRGKSGTDIHIYGRIAAVADVFDALTNKRCYKGAWSIEKTLAFFDEMKGVKFDPQLVELVFQHQDELVVIQNNYAD